MAFAANAGKSQSMGSGRSGMDMMKLVTGLFWVSVAGIVVTFGMSIYTAVQKHREEVRQTPVVVPTPYVGH